MISEGIELGFSLATHDLYFVILVEVFMNHILAENTFHKSYRVNKTQDYVEVPSSLTFSKFQKHFY